MLHAFYQKHTKHIKNITLSITLTLSLKPTLTLTLHKFNQLFPGL